MISCSGTLKQTFCSKFSNDILFRTMQATSQATSWACCMFSCLVSAIGLGQTHSQGLAQREVSIGSCSATSSGGYCQASPSFLEDCQKSFKAHEVSTHDMAHLQISRVPQVSSSDHLLLWFLIGCCVDCSHAVQTPVGSVDALRHRFGLCQRLMAKS